MVNKDWSFPKRSDGGLAAVDVFFRGYNEVYFYVEDEGQENLYFEILRKLFPNVELSKIFPLGGKLNVLAHSKDANNQALGKRIYLLDKDFDDLLGKKENLQGVIYLKEFCIENYFLDEEALIEIILESHPKENRQDISNELSLETVIPAIGNDLKPLFALFFLVQKLALGIANSSEKPEQHCKADFLWEICPQKFANYSKRVDDLCFTTGVDRLAKPILTDPRLEDFVTALDSEIVSGKFWLAMIFHYLKSKYRLGSITFDSFVFRTAKNCSFERLDYLKDAVHEIIHT